MIGYDRTGFLIIKREDQVLVSVLDTGPDFKIINYGSYLYFNQQFNIRELDILEDDCGRFFKLTQKILNFF